MKKLIELETAFHFFLNFLLSPVAQVTWDEPDVMRNVKCLSPWLVELVLNMPALHLSPFSPPRKKLRLPHHPDFPLDGNYPMPSFSGNPLEPSSPLCCLSDDITLGIQGARHAQVGVPLTDLHLGNKLQMGLLPPNFPLLDPRAKTLDRTVRSNEDSNESVSCLLSMGNSNKKSDGSGEQTPRFVLFGQPILTEQQMTYDQSRDAFSRVALGQRSSRQTLLSTEFFWKQDHLAAEIGMDIGHCKVLLEKEDVGRALDLSVLGSYDELYRKLEDVFCIEKSEMMCRLFYHDAAGAVKQAGEEPYR